MSYQDSDPGVGVGAPSVGTGPDETVTCPGWPETHLSLEDYWAFLQINECAGYGIRNFPTTGRLGMGCGDYWDQTNRYYLATAISKAEQRLTKDRWLGFPIKREYHGPRQMDYDWPIILGKYVRGVGVEAESEIQMSQGLVLSNAGVINDPVVFLVTVDFTDIDELVVRYPGTSCRILPSAISISGTTATVSIPRCRLLKPQYLVDYANDNDRPIYSDDDNFLGTVDVVRNYLDVSTGANLVWMRHEGAVACWLGVEVFACEPSAPGSDVKQTASGYVQNQRDGSIVFEPATYDAGTWTKVAYAVSYRGPDGLEINSMRGHYDRYDNIDDDLKRAIIAIAHNNMPRDYCSCSVQIQYYKADNNPIEPPVRLGLGPSTWGIYEATEIVRDFDSKIHGSYRGGFL